MKKIILFILIVVLFCAFLYVENNALLITKYDIDINTISKNVKSIKIVHISDFHSKKSMGKKVYKRINAEKPDIILITGDIIDRRKDRNFSSVIKFAKKLPGIAPTYFVPGNHEYWSGKYEMLKKQFVKFGINVMTDNKIRLKRNNIIIAGLNDPAKYYKEKAHNKSQNNGESIFLNKAHKLLSNINKNDLFLLLSHRPEFFDDLSNYNVDIVFSGHTHGGQIRLPFVGGLIAPNQGLFPEYDGGIYHENGSYLIINRGIGNSIFPFRIFNRPEIVVLELN